MNLNTPRDALARCPPASAIPDFSLVAGGPLHELLRKVRLVDSGLGYLPRRIVIIVLLAWLPLLILSLAHGYAWRAVRVPFLLDPTVHLRLLLALPLLLWAEGQVHDWMRPFARRFLERGIVPGPAYSRFAAALASLVRLRDSIYPELIIAALVATLGVWINIHRAGALTDSTWFCLDPSERAGITPAGWWYAVIGLPIFQFVLFRWFFLLFLWSQFLWRVSHLDLKLEPTHPDRAGGLGFIGSTTLGFWPVLLAQGALSAAVMARGIFYGGMTLAHYKLEICVLLALTLFWVVCPLLTFAPMMSRAKRAGRDAYGFLSQSYVLEFAHKWLRKAPAPEHLLGTSDIQSLADLSNAYQVIKTMHLIPIGKDMIALMMLFPLIPVVPLALTLLPIDKVLSHLFAAVF